jgi:hypothetical protein
VLAQTDLRLAGQRTILTGVSLWSTPTLARSDAATGGEPTEYGYRARRPPAKSVVLVDGPERGNPADDALLDGALAKARPAGIQVPMLADRGFATPTAEPAVDRHGVMTP